MERSLIFSILLIFSTFTYSEGGAAEEWVKDWWDNVYEQNIEPDNYKQIRKEQRSQCGVKIEWYRRKIVQFPESPYYEYKLEKWEERCTDR